MSLNFWKPSNVKVEPIFKPVKIFNKQNTKSIPKKNLTWPQAQVRYPRLRPFGDADRDGKLNMFDCKPFDKKRHSKVLRREIAERIYGAKYYSGLPPLRQEGAVPAYKSSRASYGKMLHRQIKEIIDKERKENIERYPELSSFKSVYPKDVIKVFEKNPDLIKQAEKAKWSDFSWKEGLEGTKSGDFDDETRTIRVSRILPKHTNVRQIIKHELGHLAQLEEGQAKLLEEEGEELLAQKRRDIEEKEVENWYKWHSRTPTGRIRRAIPKEVIKEAKLTAQRRAPRLHWEDRPIEQDAIMREKMPTARQLAKEELEEKGPAIDTLKSLDLPEDVYDLPDVEVPDED